MSISRPRVERERLAVERIRAQTARLEAEAARAKVERELANVRGLPTAADSALADRFARLERALDDLARRPD